MSTVAVGGRETLVVAAPAFNGNAPGAAGPAWLRRVASTGGDVLLLAGLILCFPFAILAIGIPVAALVRLLVWIVTLV